MQIIERFIKSREPSRECEDRIVANNMFVAVIDGAGDPAGRSLGGHSLGWRAADAVGRAIEDLPVYASVSEAVERTTASMRALTRELSDAGLQNGDPPAASIVMFSGARREVWRVGDCGYRIGSYASLPARAFQVAIINARRAILAACALRTGVEWSEESEKYARQSVDALASCQRWFENASPDIEWAFGVIDGSTVPSAFVECVAVPQDMCEIVLSSDGYPEIGATLADTEEVLARLAAEDPYCMHRIDALKPIGAGGSYDDRAYVRIRL